MACGWYEEEDWDSQSIQIAFLMGGDCQNYSVSALSNGLSLGVKTGRACRAAFKLDRKGLKEELSLNSDNLACTFNINIKIEDGDIFQEMINNGGNEH